MERDLLGLRPEQVEKSHFLGRGGGRKRPKKGCRTKRPKGRVLDSALSKGSRWETGKKGDGCATLKGNGGNILTKNWPKEKVEV